MTRHKQIIALAFVALFALSAIAPAAAAQTQQSAHGPAVVAQQAAPTEQAQNESQNESSEPAVVEGESADTDEEYTIADLRDGGVKPANAPASVRQMGSTGAIAVRHESAAPGNSEMKFLKPGKTVNTNKLQLYSTRFGRNIEPQKYRLNIMFWQPRQRQVQRGNTTETVTRAENKSLQRYDVTLGTGYDAVNVSMPAHFDATWQATAWLSDENGDAIEGARWRFGHQTIASATPVDVNNAGDLWTWVATNVLLIAGPGLIGAAVVAKGVVRLAGSGPGKGFTWWSIVTGGIAFTVFSAYYVSAARIISRVPQMFGIVIVLVAFVVMLETVGPKLRTDEFVRDELGDAAAPMGERVRNHLYRDKERVYTVRRDEGLGLIKKGIRPFTARIFANPAIVKDSTLKTAITIADGPDDNLFIADPDSEEPLVWDAAHWEFDPRFYTPDTDIESGFERVFSGLNWPLFALTAVGAGAGHVLFEWLLNAPQSGAVVGAIAAFVGVSLRAVDGAAEFRPAPVHYDSARASITALGVTYSDSKSLQDAFKQKWEADARTAQEAAALQAQKDETLSEKMAENETGIDFSKISEGRNVQVGQDDESASETHTPRNNGAHTGDGHPAADGGEVNDDDE